MLSMLADGDKEGRALELLVFNRCDFHYPVWNSLVAI